jgi:electron transfer flavoprotein beta subunit
MHIAVCLKHVPDPATVEADPITGIIAPERLLYFTDPASEVALEYALQVAAPAGTVRVLTVGTQEAEAVLRRALSVGASSALRLWDAALHAPAPMVVARLLAAALQTDGMPDVLLCGSRSADQGSGQVPALLAEYLGWPVATDVTHLEMHTGHVRVQCRLARGAREERELRLPAIIALEPGLLRLRQASMMGMLTAARADIPVSSLADLGLTREDVRLPAPLLQAVGPARPRPRAMFMPDSSQPAHERIEQIISAGVTRKAGQMIEGQPDEMAEAIVAFLREQGFVEAST